MVDDAAFDHVRTDAPCTAERIYASSFLWLAGAMAINALLLALGLVLGDGSTPPEVVGADIGFLTVTIILVPFVVRRTRLALYGALALGLALVMRTIGDPDLGAAFEDIGARVFEAGYFALFVSFAFVQTLSAYGAVVLRRTHVAGGEHRRGGRETTGTTGEVGRRWSSRPPKSPRRGLLDSRFIIAIIGVGALLAVGIELAATAPPASQSDPGPTKVFFVAARSPEAGGFNVSEIRVKLGDHVVLYVKSMDGKHGIALSTPWVHISVPVSAGDEKRVEFEARQQGTWFLLCPNPYCSPDHGQMRIVLVIE